MTERNLNRIEALKKMLEEKTRGRKMDEVNALVEDMKYALNHMDEGEYGMPMMHNLMKDNGLEDGEFTNVEDYIVRNTQHDLMFRIRALMSNRKLEDSEPVDPNETLRKGSNWLYRGYMNYLRRCKRDYTVHFKCGKRGKLPTIEEMCQMYGKMISEFEN